MTKLVSLLPYTQQNTLDTLTSNTLKLKGAWDKGQFCARIGPFHKGKGGEESDAALSRHPHT